MYYFLYFTCSTFSLNSQLRPFATALLDWVVVNEIALLVYVDIITNVSILQIFNVPIISFVVTLFHFKTAASPFIQYTNTITRVMLFGFRCVLFLFSTD